jgi:hypothetical protein
MSAEIVEKRFPIKLFKRNFFDRSSFNFEKITNVSSLISNNKYIIRDRRSGHLRKDYIATYNNTNPADNNLKFHILWERIPRTNDDDKYNSWESPKLGNTDNKKPNTLRQIEKPININQISVTACCNDDPDNYKQVYIFELGNNGQAISESKSPNSVSNDLMYAIDDISNNMGKGVKPHVLTQIPPEIINNITGFLGGKNRRLGSNKKQYKKTRKSKQYKTRKSKQYKKTRKSKQYKTRKNM